MLLSLPWPPGSIRSRWLRPTWLRCAKPPAVYLNVTLAALVLTAAV
jgi:hypothetical protein